MRVTDVATAKTEQIIRFVTGGLIVSLFAILSDMLRPKSFAGLLGAAPSVALATLSIGVFRHGTDYAAAESWTMMYGAAALGCYCFVVCQLLVRWRFAAMTATIISFVVWLAVAFTLLAEFDGVAA